MKALVLHHYNTPFSLEDITRPDPGPGEVLVRIKASSVNPLDLKIAAGQAAHAQTRLPAILGIDMAGVVEAVGKGVTNFAIGDAVFGMTGGVGGVPGSLAEYAAVDSRLIAKQPTHLTHRESAALPLAFITAWEGLVDRAGVRAGHRVLIHGGAGGVGHLAVQLAIARGASVYTTATADDSSRLEQYGAVPIDYTRSSVDDYVNQYTAGEGFDIVLDTIGGAVLDASFTAAKRYTGHVVSILGWGTHSLAPLSFRGATYSGVFTLYPLISGQGRSHHGTILREAAALAEAGQLMPNVSDERFTLTTISAAYEALDRRPSQGKIIINL